MIAGAADTRARVCVGCEAARSALACARRGTALALLAGLSVTGCRLRFDEAAGDAALASDAGSDAAADAATLTLVFGDRSGAPTTSDTNLIENSPTVSHGSVDNISVSGGPGFNNHALLRFDLSGVPAGLTVVRAELELELMDLDDQRAGAVAVRAVGESWVEATATWVSRGPAAWAAAGGSLGPQLMSFTPPDAGAFTFELPVALVQGWLDDPAQNHGMAFAPENPASTMHYHFHSRDTVVASRRPQLVLELQ
jgi:hypothetical protein